MKIEASTSAEAPLLAALDQAQRFSAHWSEPDWRSELTYSAARVWGAWCTAQLVGFIALRGAVDQFEITNLAVAEHYLRRGIGTALLTHALTHTNGKQFTLEVSQHNHPARSLYEKNGFIVVGVRRQFYPDGADALLMEKQV